MKVSITSNTGYPFRRDGIVFNPSIPVIMDEKDLTQSIKDTPALTIKPVEKQKSSK